MEEPLQQLGRSLWGSTCLQSVSRTRANHDIFDVNPSRLKGKAQYFMVCSLCVFLLLFLQHVFKMLPRKTGLCRWQCMHQGSHAPHTLVLANGVAWKTRTRSRCMLFSATSASLEPPSLRWKRFAMMFPKALLSFVFCQILVWIDGEREGLHEGLA